MKSKILSAARVFAGALAVAAPAFAAPPARFEEQTEAASALVSTVQREGEWFCSISAPRRIH